jgi:hypothetical protein
MSPLFFEALLLYVAIVVLNFVFQFIFLLILNWNDIDWHKWL